MLLEAGINYGDSSFTWKAQPSVIALKPGPDSPANYRHRVVPVVEQGGTLSPPITYRAPTTQLYDPGGLHRYAMRASLSYTTGSHNVKVGMDNTFGINQPTFINQTGYILISHAELHSEPTDDVCACFHVPDERGPDPRLVRAGSLDEKPPHDHGGPPVLISREARLMRYERADSVDSARGHSI